MLSRQRHVRTSQIKVSNTAKACCARALRAMPRASQPPFGRSSGQYPLSAKRAGGPLGRRCLIPMHTGSEGGSTARSELNHCSSASDPGSEKKGASRPARAHALPCKASTLPTCMHTACMQMRPCVCTHVCMSSRCPRPGAPTSCSGGGGRTMTAEWRWWAQYLRPRSQRWRNAMRALSMPVTSLPPLHTCRRGPSDTGAVPGFGSP